MMSFSSDIPQRTEKRVAVPAESDVARLPRQWRSGNVANGTAQGLWVVAFHEHDGEPEARNFKPANQASGPNVWERRLAHIALFQPSSRWRLSRCWKTPSVRGYKPQ